MTPFLIALLICLPFLIAIPLIPYLRRLDAPWVKLREQWFSFPISNSFAVIPFIYGLYGIGLLKFSGTNDRSFEMMLLLLPIGSLTLGLTAISLVGFLFPASGVRHRRKGHLITLALCSPVLLPLFAIFLTRCIKAIFPNLLNTQEF